MSSHIPTLQTKNLPVFDNGAGVNHMPNVHQQVVVAASVAKRIAEAKPAYGKSESNHGMRNESNVMNNNTTNQN